MQRRQLLAAASGEEALKMDREWRQEFPERSATVEQMSEVISRFSPLVKERMEAMTPPDVREKLEAAQRALAEIIYYLPRIPAEIRAVHGDYAASIQFSERAWALWRRLGDQTQTPFLCVSLGMATNLNGDEARGDVADWRSWIDDS